MTSQSIGSDNHLSSPVRAKEECGRSHDLFSYQVMDCSATRIPSSIITGRHPRPTGSLIGGGITPLQSCSQHILQPQPTGQAISEEYISKTKVKITYRNRQRENLFITENTILWVMLSFIIQTSFSPDSRKDNLTYVKELLDAGPGCLFVGAAWRWTIILALQVKKKTCLRKKLQKYS